MGGDVTGQLGRAYVLVHGLFGMVEGLGVKIGVGEWEHGLVLKINVQLAHSLKFKSDPS